MSEVVKEKKLTAKERRFCDRYLYETRFNGLEAARGVYDAKNDQTLKSIASENLSKPYLKAYVDAGLAAMAMSGNEIIARLNDIARGKLTDFYNEDGKFDLQTAKQNRVDHLLKKIKTKSTSKVLSDGDEGIETHLLFEEVDFEIYSAHEALRDLGKVLKLFTDRIEQTGASGGAIKTETTLKLSNLSLDELLELKRLREKINVV